jgi:hypothetical protein
MGRKKGATFLAERVGPPAPLILTYDPLWIERDLLQTNLKQHLRFRARDLSAADHTHTPFVMCLRF